MNKLKVLKVIVELEELKVLKVQDKGSFRRWCDSLFAPQPQLLSGEKQILPKQQQTAGEMAAPMESKFVKKC